MVFLKKKNLPQKKKKKKFTFFLCNFSVRTLWCFQKNLKKNFDPEKVKKQAKKVAHNWPRPFYFTVQPRPTAHSPELILHIMKSRGTRHLFSYLWCTSGAIDLGLIVETYSHLSNKRDVTLTDFGKFHPAQNKNPPCTFINF